MLANAYDDDYVPNGRSASKKATMKASQYTTTTTYRGAHVHASAPKGPSKTREARGSSSQPTHARDQFINTSCKMGVLTDCDCGEVEQNADLMVPWDRIQFVQMPCHEDHVCPICLGPPLAPRMTRCGHVFCW
jgi:hypothetical protein